MPKNRDFTDFSDEEITNIAKRAGQEAAKESLEAGIEILSKDVSTGKFFYEKRDENGQVTRRFLTDEEVEALRNE